MFSYAFASSSGVSVTLWSNIIGFAIFIFAAYFFLFRPQRKKIESHDLLIKSLKIGDLVITVGGIICTVASINDEDIDIIVSDGISVKVAKYAISELVVVQKKENKSNKIKSNKGKVKSVKSI